jgi:hypothetical protein
MRQVSPHRKWAILVVGLAVLMVLGVILGPVLLRVVTDSSGSHHTPVSAPVAPEHPS